MEDAHAAVLDLQAKYLDKSHRPTDPDKRLSFFGVYDGHGGEKVALFAGENVHRIIALQDAFAEGDIEQALRDGFLATDRAILEDPKYEEEVSGCTASVAVISKEKIRVANAGDSRSVLGVKGRAKPLSFDHKPQNEGEKARISAAGGFVDYGRVNGNLALSRALGDFEFKKSADLAPEQQIVTAYPDVTTHEITEDDEFLVIACDGIWDCQPSQAVIEFVRRGIAEKQELYRICENMMDNCLASSSETGGVGCDNMTMVIIGLLHGKTKEEWYKTIADRVANGDGPCAPPEYAEFRGPAGRRRGNDNLDDYEPGLRAGRSGRIILLGDGTEVLTDMGDEDMFDHTEEDEDLESQVRKGGAGHAAAGANHAARGEREGTPGPQPHQKQHQRQQQLSNRQGNPNATGDNTQQRSESPGTISASPSSTTPNDVLQSGENQSTS
ncbi:hypothetical protein ACJ72_07726 [Emergomyces africanus]|uniref:Protein phosphatase 2C homolog 2 n=1 Tax=Emergomyces africanus TaxID=1955775 RepID=A0A1B7NMA7_9EURO|nr:hypothetical protein ACJ72_07726 [Emergomyces africanus]